MSGFEGSAWGIKRRGREWNRIRPLLLWDWHNLPLLSSSIPIYPHWSNKIFEEKVNFFFLFSRARKSEHGIFHFKTGIQKMSAKVWTCKKLFFFLPLKFPVWSLSSCFPETACWQNIFSVDYLRIHLWIYDFFMAKPGKGLYHRLDLWYSLL